MALTKAKLIKDVTLVLIKTLFFISVCILCGGKRGGGEVWGLGAEEEDCLGIELWSSKRPGRL